ncbi:MAG TPA: hypothetical protein VF596_13650 [Pyrinomonadaceae bacterium]|jgi:hypothetical protein
MRKKALKWTKRNKLSVGLATIFFLVGYLAGFGTQFGLSFKLQFDEKINTADFLSIVCNIILVWIVATILDKEKQTEQNAKDILLRRVEELYNFTITVSDKSTSGNFLYTEATSSTKKINLITTSVYEQLNSNNLTVDEKFKKDISEQVDKLNNLMTNTPVNGSTDSNPPVKAENNKLFYNEIRSLEIDSGFDKLRELITSLELAINDA